MKRLITFHRQPQHEIYWQAVKKHNDNFLTINKTMADIADGLINGDFDFLTGEYIGNGGGYPRAYNFKTSRKWTPEQKRINRELKALQAEYELQGVKDAENKARCEINKIYGKGWRDEII